MKDCHLKKKAITHLHQQQANDEPGALAVADLAVVERVRLHHVEQGLLAEPILLFEKVMFRIRARDVATYHLFARGFSLKILIRSYKDFCSVVAKQCPSFTTMGRRTIINLLIL